MKNGPQVSPVIGGVIIVLVLAVVVIGLMKFTGSRGKVQLSPDQVKQMQQMMGNQGAAQSGMRAQHSLPPGGAPPPK